METDTVIYDIENAVHCAFTDYSAEPLELEREIGRLYDDYGRILVDHAIMSCIRIAYLRLQYGKRDLQSERR